MADAIPRLSNIAGAVASSVAGVIYAKATISSVPGNNEKIQSHPKKDRHNEKLKN